MKRSPGSVLALFGGALVALLFGARAIVGAEQLGGISGAAVMIVFLLVGAALIVGGLVLQGRPSLLAYRALHAEFPDAAVVRILASPDFRFGVNRFLKLPLESHVPKFVVVVVREQSLEFWASRPRAPFLTLDRKDIAGVRVKETSNTGYAFRTRVPGDMGRTDMTAYLDGARLRR